MTRSILVALVCALAACTSFDAIGRDVCGNGVIEAGEDCDSSDASCVRCAVACSTNGDCPTADYACGVDGLCHAPGGALGQAVAAGPFQVNEMAVTDVDHDGTGDVLGLSKTSIVVRHGDAAGALTAVESLVTPSQLGPAAIGDLDGDGSLDVTITTPDGLISYTAPFGTLSPLTVPSTILDQGMALDIRMLFRISPTTLGGFIVESDRVYVMIVDLLDPTGGVVTPPCGARIGAVTTSTFSTSKLDTYQVSADGALSADWVVAMTAGTGPSAKLCVMSIHKDAIGAAQVTDITPVNAVAPVRRAVLADLDGDLDRCPGLVTSDGGPMALRSWDGQLVGSRCTLKPSLQANGDPLPAITNAAPGAAAVDRIVLDPAIPGVASDVLVLTDGLYAFVPFTQQFSQFYKSPRKLARAAHGDLSGDGAVDAVLTAENEDDLDVLYRVVPPVGQGYQLLRLDTASQVTTVTLGDYDGNGVNDIAYTEQIADYQRLMVAFGTSDRPLDPVQVGTLGADVSITRVDFPDSVDQSSLASDLAVLQPNPSGHTATLTILHGSPQRTLMPYFDPRTVKAGTQFRGSVIGQFAPSPAGAEYPDIFGIAPPDPDTTNVDTPVRAWRVPGTSTGVDGTENDGLVVNGFANCSTGTASGLCTHDTAYLAWPIEPSRDVVIGIDRAQAPHAAMVDPWSAGASSVTATSLTAITSKIPADTTVHSLHGGDFDGDGAPDLIAAFAPVRSTPARGAVLVCAMDGGIPRDCTDLVPSIVERAPATTACIDAAPARVAYRDPLTAAGASLDLVVLCRDEGSTLYRVHHGDAGLEIEPLAHTSHALGAVQVGDVTGDGVEDVVALEGDSGAQSLVVYPQCTSRNLTTCQRNAAGGAP
jgi:hypothetical protein